MSNQFKSRFVNLLEEMAKNPVKQIKQLATGTLISLVTMGLILVTSDLENQSLFYLLSFVTVLGIIYAIPGYLGIWVWRMKDSLFKSKKRDSNSPNSRH